MISHSKFKKKVAFLFLLSLLCVNLFSLIALVKPASAGYIGTNLLSLADFQSDTFAFANYAYWDTSVHHIGNNPSIRLTVDGTARQTREVDCFGLNIKPGDHVYYAMWVKTDPFNSLDPLPGARIGMDFYGSAYINGVSVYGSAVDPDGVGQGLASNPPHAYGITVYPNDNVNQYNSNYFRIPWGVNWTLLAWDFIVPTFSYTKIYVDGIQNTDAPYKINSCAVWIDAREISDNAYAWFAEPIFYVNPATSDTEIPPSPIIEGSVIIDTVGNEDNYGTARYYLISSPITATHSGNITSIGVQCQSTVGDQVRVALYSNRTGGFLSGLLGQSTSNTTILGWNDLSIGTGINITAGTTYYAAFQCSGESMFYGGPVGTEDALPFSYASFPDPTGSYSTYNFSYNLRMSYIVTNATARYHVTLATNLGGVNASEAISFTPPEALNGTGAIFGAPINATANSTISTYYFNYFNITDTDTGYIITNSTTSNPYIYVMLDRNMTITAYYSETAPTPTPTPTPAPTATPFGGILYPAMLNVYPFWVYLFNGNLLGFFQAIFLSAFLIQDILYGAITLLFFAPIYIRTKSLMTIAVLWILLGSFFIVAMPSVSVLAIIFLVLGVASVLWKLVHPN